MFSKSDMARLEFVVLIVKDIEIIVARHGTVENTLDDVEGLYALLMCCQQIGETLFKLQDDTIKNGLPIQSAYGMRNIIAHGYLGINSKIVAKIISDDIPELKSKIEILLKNSR